MSRANPVLMEAAGQSREALRLELAAELLNGFGELRFRAYGGSMLPGIFPGDVLVVRREAIGGIRRGHIVLSSRSGRFYAHRVVRTENHEGKLRLITRGDALRTEDPAVSEVQLLGRVTGFARRGAQIELPESLSLASCIFGWALRHSDFLTALLRRWHCLRTRRKEKAEAAASANPEMAGKRPR